jgi:hypothetical protein
MVTSSKHTLMLFLLLVAMAIPLASCSRISRFAHSAKSPYYTTTYEEVCHEWTRQTRVHHGFEVEFIIDATFKSKAFRRAYADEYGEAHKLTAQQKKTFLEEQLLQADSYHEIQMASFVPEKKWNEFDKPQSMWKLYLVNDRDERVEPVAVKKLKKRDAIVAHFFPYVTPWKSVYVVTFPYRIPGTNRPLVSENTSNLTMVIASVLGTAEVIWNLE